jgi:hypothetical protein
VVDQSQQYIEGAIRWALSKQGAIEYWQKCYAFLEDAYELGNDITLDGKGSSAKEAAEAYGAKQYSGVPQRGAYVCYDWWGVILGEYHNWGHIGLSLGDGNVIHAWDHVRIDDYLQIANLAAGAPPKHPELIGWVPVSEILTGMKVK